MYVGITLLCVQVVLCVVCGSCVVVWKKGFLGILNRSAFIGRVTAGMDDAQRRIDSGFRFPVHLVAQIQGCAFGRSRKVTVGHDINYSEVTPSSIQSKQRTTIFHTFFLFFLYRLFWLVLLLYIDID